MTSLFDRLPDEIIHEICKYFCFHCNKDPTAVCSVPGDGWRKPLVMWRACCMRTRDLARLCLTSKRLYQIANSILYHAMMECGSFPPNALFFLRTISKRPDLASKTKDIVINMNMDMQIEHNAVINDIAESLGVELPEGWEPLRTDELGEIEMNMDEHELHLSFIMDHILSRVPGLERLSLQLSEDIEYGKFMPPTASFPSLKKLSLINCDSSAGFSMSQAYDILAGAVNLEQLELHSCTDIDLGIEFENLKSLKLINVMVPKWDLQSLIFACPNVAAFSFQYVGGFNKILYLESGEITTLKELAEELRPWRATLQHIAVEIESLKDNVVSIDGDIVPNFKDFVGLKTLVLTEASIGIEQNDERLCQAKLADMLPPSIEVVEIKGVKPNFYKAVKSLKKQLRTDYFPNFKKCRIDKAGSLHRYCIQMN